MRKLISLGFSCQSRFSIDAVSAEHRRFPLDYNITTKAALLDALKTSGASYRPGDVERLQIHLAQREGREGPTRRGVWYWHDFPMQDQNLLRSDWRDAAPAVNKKYDAMWRRFIDLLGDPDKRFTFVLSNSQSNLGQFATSYPEFFDRFGFTAEFVHELRETLLGHGVIDPEIRLLNRYLGESVDINRDIAEPWFRSVFAGRLSLPTHAKWASATLGANSVAPELDAVVGLYDDGIRIEKSSGAAALIFDADKPVAELQAISGGYLAVFEEGFDTIRSAVRIEGGDLYWSDKSVWRRR